MTGTDDLDWLRRSLDEEYRIERTLCVEDGVLWALAGDRTLDRLVVIAAPVPSAETTGHREAFLRRGGLLARVQHPNVRAVYRAGRAGGNPFVALEHLAGEPLDRRIARGRLPPADVVRLGRDILRALEASHASGVAHPGLVASSIVCQSTGAVLAGFHADTLDDGRRGSDLQAAASVLYEAATGRRWDPAVADASRPLAAIPRRLRPILRRALAPRTEDRWPDATAFRRALDRVGTSRPRAGRGLAAVAGLLVVLAVFRGRLESAPPPGGPPKQLAVLPLDVVGGPPDSLGAAFAHLLRLTLDAVPGLEITSPRRIAIWLDRHEGDASGRQAQAARELNAHWVAHGFISRDGGALRVRLTLYDSSNGKTPLAEVDGDTDHLERLADTLSLRMLPTVAPDLEPRLGGLQEFSGIPFGALKAFLQGEAAFERDAWKLAQLDYESATRADPGFALAQWRLVNVKRWRRIPYDFFGELPGFYRRFGARLPAPDRAVVEALLEPDVTRRLARLDTVVAQSPSDPYLRFLYAEELFHRGPLVGERIDSAVGAMAETIKLDSSFAEAYNHIFTVHLRTGRRAEARKFLVLRRRISLKPWPGDPDVASLMALAYDERFLRWRGGLKLWALGRWGGTARMSDLARVARLGAPWFDLPATQVTMGRILLRRGVQTDSARASALTGVALGNMTLGRPARALAQLDSAVAADSSPEARLQRAEWRAVPAVTGLPVATPAEAIAWRAAFEAFAAEEAGLEPALARRARWALALDHLAAGDTAAFIASATRFDSLTLPSPLGALLRAIVAGIHGAPAAALATSDSVRAVFEVNQPPDPFAGAVFHLLRGRWRAALGDARGAEREWRWYEGSDFIGWPAGVPQAGEIEATFSVYARWLRGSQRLATASTAADTASACAMLRRVVELWAGSDSAFGPLHTAAGTRVHACPA